MPFFTKELAKWNPYTSNAKALSIEVSMWMLPVTLYKGKTYVTPCLVTHLQNDNVCHSIRLQLLQMHDGEEQ